MRVLIRNARLVDPGRGLDGRGDIFVEEGGIRLNPGPECERAASRVIEAEGLVAAPGLMDMHVHLREPGHEYKEDIASGLLAAARGGFTAVAAMPNTRPVNDCRAVTEYMLEAAKAAGLARLCPVAAMTLGSRGQEFTEFGELAGAGAVAVSDDGRPVTDARLMRRIIEYASAFGLLPISHAEELGLSAGGVMNEGPTATRLGLAGIPSASEEVAVYREISLARLTGLPVHIAHVSTAEAVWLIARAKDEGLRVTAETAPHYFTLTQEAALGYDTNAKMNPPLRTARDREAIRRGLADGTIDAIATDHAPHSSLEKETEFELAAFGIIGLETALPLALGLVAEGLIGLGRLVELMSLNPRRLLGVETPGLADGAPADFTLIDPRAVWTVSRATIASKSLNTPFLGREMTGRAVFTVYDGRITNDLLG